MSSKKRAKKWDREEGRRTLYFSQEELPILIKLAAEAGLDEATYLKSIFRRVVSGRLVKVEKVEAYKHVIDKLIAAGKKSPEVPVYGKEKSPSTDDPLKPID